MVTRVHTLLALMLLLCVPAFGARVQASLDANRVATGEGASFTIQVTGGQPEQPAMPNVPGLTVEFQSKNQMFSMINGVTTQTVSFTYLIGSQKSGDYIIPHIIVKVDGSTLTTDSIKLTVYDDGTGKPDQLPPDPRETDPKQWGFMTIHQAASERKDIYLGEIAPVRIQAWFPMDAQVQLQSILQPESGSYTLHNLSNQPQQSVETKNGISYRVLTWFGGISATKAGAQTVKLSMKLTVARPDETKPILRPRKGQPSAFNPFGRGAGTRYLEKEITLISDAMSLEVRPLPEEGRPANFSGAVGDFAFDALEIPSQWKTGEPQRVALRIKGSGNFANMKAPELSPAELWKWYPGQDQFTPGDIASFSGSKVFQYHAIAKKNGSHTVAFELSYFDPQKARYLTARSQERTIQISGEPVEEKETPAVATAEPTPTTPDDGRASLRSNGAKSWSQAQFIRDMNLSRINAFALVLAMAAPVFAFWKSKSRDPERLSRLQHQVEVRDAMKRMEVAQQQQDIAAFWSAALLVLRIKLAPSWQMSAQAISLHDVSQRCGTDSPVTIFFCESDRWIYSTEQLPPDWSRWRSLHQQALLSMPS